MDTLIIFKVTHFTVIDMVGDKIPEVVLELAVGNNLEFYECLALYELCGLWI